ncbi:glycoside hydrolase family 1 protein [Leifsonia poae]|uniref:glycoside hydrolase family 1 protein n=1 Tax=Leifsonia poae TaxID=110933 RepID=UPI003D67AFA8
MLKFPENFLWGAATAAHQVEGNNTNSDWWTKEHASGTPIVEPSLDAADSFHRYPEDMRLLADAGLTAYRFSLEWARIEPERGRVSQAMLDHYRRMIDTALDHGLDPVITLLHFTVPQWMHEAGFWHNPESPELFARYTESVLPILQTGVRTVCTINEPNIAAMLAGAEDESSLAADGGLPAPDPVVAERLLEAHRRSREILSTVPGIRSGWTVATQDFQSSGEQGADEALRDYGYVRDDWYLEASRGDDFVGVQAYTRTRIGPNGPLPLAAGTETTLTGWEYYPDAAAHGIRAAWELSGGIPILVTENGIATADDGRRIDYTRDSLRAIHGAIEDGIDVRGYLHWSALDNYEWASGYAPTFGLIAVDRKTFARTPKPSLHWLGSVAARNALDVG